MMCGDSTGRRSLASVPPRHSSSGTPTSRPWRCSWTRRASPGSSSPRASRWPMPTLAELQGAFGQALLGGDEQRAAALVLGDGLTPESRLGVYRHHVFTTLTAALKSTYPVVCRLVDERFFGYAADRYIRSHPPEGPCLVE